ncbi:MAG: hypothetical protein DWI12_13165 [Planctomycetota bacterium]|nr:MAG: hypothetical protein DWI12_13165 [Planctomycetota bacterium]
MDGIAHTRACEAPPDEAHESNELTAIAPTQQRHARRSMLARAIVECGDWYRTCIARTIRESVATDQRAGARDNDREHSRHTRSR